MNQLVKWIAVALVCCCVTSQAWAGIALPFGNFNTSVPSTQSLTPGQIFPVTLTANTNLPGIAFSSPFVLNPNVGNQFVVVPGGTCALATSYTNGQTCTVLVQFLGTTSGSFTADLLGQCQFSAQLGGFGVNCEPGSTQSILGRFAGNGLAAVVDALGASGLSVLMLAVLGIGAFVTLRRSA